MKQSPENLNPVVIHQCWSDNEASIVVSCLADYGIDAVTNSAIPHEVYPFTVDGLGAVQVLVAPGQAEDARETLRQHVMLNESVDA